MTTGIDNNVNQTENQRTRIRVDEFNVGVQAQNVQKQKLMQTIARVLTVVGIGLGIIFLGIPLAKFVITMGLIAGGGYLAYRVASAAQRGTLKNEMDQAVDMGTQFVNSTVEKLKATNLKT